MLVINRSTFAFKVNEEFAFLPTDTTLFSTQNLKNY